jgi:hypothetical protein
VGDGLVVMYGFEALVVMYGLVDLCSCSDVIYMCYVSTRCDIVIYIYMFVNVERKK